MANSYFQFKRFTVCQQHCAMKVGTDGTLLGAWAAAPQAPGRILDIGTGTGLIALMMAQRFPEALVTAIDIDEMAVSQAAENVAASPFADRISVVAADLQTFRTAEKFDSIVCNPPFFEDSLTCPDPQRTEARHTVTLGYRQLMESVFRLLKDDGLFSVIIPTDCRARLESEAHLRGFFISRVCSIQTTPRKAPKRYMIEMTKQPVNEVDTTNGVLESSPQIRSDWYHELTKEFYIK
jgi:tRNA1Val (adenine37-N6)-methyltransferase